MRSDPRLRSFVQLAVFVAASFVVRASFADHYRVPSESMEPTVRAGDHVFVNKAAYGIRVPATTTYVMRTADPARGDVVVLEGVEDPPIVLLKRVVAIGGDLVEVKDGFVFIDGALSDDRAHGGPDFGPERVPSRHVLVLGDNRSNSRDGRTFGFVPIDRVLGRVVGTLH